jgi:glycosyltransferase involved in cell wall biosynthesis
MEDKKFRVALFMLPPLTQGGGAEKYFISLAKNISEKGYQVDIITMDESFFRKFARLLYIYAMGDFFGKIDIKGREKEDEIKKQLGHARWNQVKFGDLGKVLRNYDIIYTKNELVDLFLLKLKRYKKLPPVIVGMHTAIFYPQAKSYLEKIHNFLYSGFIYRWLLRGIKHVHVTNKFAKEFVRSKFKKESDLIYYPISVEELHELAKENKSGLNFDNGKMNIIFLGRLSKQKGIDILADIVRKIEKEEKIKGIISLNIFGSGDQKNTDIIRNLEKKHSFVKYYGHIENKFIPNILERHDFLITTSRWETMGYNVLEAQAMGVPVVAFDISGPADIIANKKTGFSVTNEKEFMEKIISIVTDKAQFNKKEIIENIENRFNPKIIYGHMLSMFQHNI